jgi:D-arabinose 1-dehydrogenase-like Zn-dependent alcohol dehydrogenase
MATSAFTGKQYDVYRGIEGKITGTPVSIPALGPHDVLIRLTHTGVCYSDLEFFNSGAPLALGHEGVGEVVAIGSEVTQFKIGDRAGGGFHKDSCGHCHYCLTGNDIYCNERIILGEGDYNNGTFGQYYIGKETYVHKIPDSIPSEEAAPLQCAGATVYSALVNNVKPAQRVGVMGIGGLGHLAIQFASKLGTEVVVFSTSKSKEQEAKGFGASEFVLLDQLEKLRAPVDVLVLTASKFPDWEK